MPETTLKRSFRRMGLLTALLFLTACGAKMDETPVEHQLPTPEVMVTERVEQEVVPVHDASGLVFTNADGTWWINWDGELELLTPYGSAQVSPDGTMLVYAAEDSVGLFSDIWLELTDGEERSNLTNTPDRDEVMPVWLPARPQSLLFGSDTASGMENSLYPTIVNLDGSGYQLLDETTGGLRGASPDGEIIFYGGYDDALQTFSWDDGEGSFNPSEYGLDVDKLFQPEWSPDGRYVAFFVAGNFPQVEGDGLAIAVFDLADHSSIVMHVYQPVGGSMFNNELAWSPDGMWLAFTTYAEPPASGRAPNLWVIRPDGSDEQYLGAGSAPVWRYDSALLAYQGLNDSQTEEVVLVERDSWAARTVENLFPERILFLLEWVTPPGY